MAVINTTVSDDVDDMFRAAVAKRLGYKKGNMQIALEEAMRQWAMTDELADLKKIAKDGTSSEKTKAVKILRKYGKLAVPILTSIAKDDYSSSLKQEALDAIDAILDKENS
ncbi:MAG TPA: hypothetical protein VI338_01355 [Nitrososphaera sp.]|nr:hypothetical protein [Nitrososphaera sp.]